MGTKDERHKETGVGPQCSACCFPSCLGLACVQCFQHWTPIKKKYAASGGRRIAAQRWREHRGSYSRIKPYTV